MEKKKTLLDLMQLSNELTAKLIESGGVLDPDTEQLMEFTVAELSGKVDAYCHVMRRLEHEAAYFRDEAKRYATVAKALESSHKRVKERIKFVMDRDHVYELPGENEIIKIVQRAPTLLIDLTQLPSVYKKEEVTLVANDDLIRYALDTGPVPGAELKPSYTLRTYPRKRVLE